jgi:hypothetical protein
VVILEWIYRVSSSASTAIPSRINFIAVNKNIYSPVDGCKSHYSQLISLVGIWLLIYSAVLFIDGRMQVIPFWPFAILSVASGVLGLLPYLAVREPNQRFSGQKDAFLNFLDSRVFGIILSFSTIPILVYGLSFGNWGDFAYQFQNDLFIHGMSLAFCLFCLLFPTVLGDDMARRRWQNSQVFWTVSLIPLIGSLAYLCLRPSLAVPVGRRQENPA